MTGRRLALVAAEEVESMRKHDPIWVPVAAAPGRTPTTSEVLQRTRVSPDLPPQLEAELLAVIVRPIGGDETRRDGNAARERELYGLLATLDVTQAFHLGRRLDAMRADDALVRAFSRLIPERRQRLRAFIADTRRRVMLSSLERKAGRTAS